MDNQNKKWFKAAMSGDLTTIDQMINMGINLNIKNDDYKETAMIIAAQRNNWEVVERLIKGNPLAVLNMILEWKNSGRKLNDQSILKWKNRIAVDVNPTNWFSVTALVYATREQNERIVKLLIRAGADVNVKCRGDYNSHHEYITLLMDAVKRKSIKIIKLLIDAGADINASSRCVNCDCYFRCKECGKTALMKAVENGNVAAVKLLLNANAHTSGIYLYKLHNYEIRRLISKARYG